MYIGRVDIPTLRQLCIAKVLESSRHCDRASLDACTDLLVEHFSINALTKAAFHSPAALAGLKHLASSGDGEWALVDAARNYLGRLKSHVHATAYFRSVEASLRHQLEVDKGKKSDDVAAVCRDVAAVCKAFLGNDRFKRDMTGVLLPKVAADRCRALRNLAEAHEEANVSRQPMGRAPSWRFQEHRQAASRGNLRPLPVRGPWFPGYEH